MEQQYSKSKLYRRLFLINIFCTLSIANATRSLGSIQILFLGVTKIVLVAFVVASLVIFINKSRCVLSTASCTILPSAIYIIIRCLFKNYGFSIDSYFVVIFLYFSCIVLFQNESIYQEMMKACVLGGYGLILYLLYSYGGVFAFLRSIQSDAVANIIVQKNILAYVMAIVVLVCFYKVINEKKLVFLVLMIPPIIVAIGTGSRRGLIAIAVSIVALIVFRDFNYKVLINIGAAILLIYLSYIILKQMNLGYVMERIESLLSLFSDGDDLISSDQGRMDMIRYGLQMFKEKPVFGNGADAFKHLSGYNIYSHNNFVELLANYGIVGFALYYYVYLVLFKKLIDIAKSGDDFAKFLLAYIVMRIVSDFGNVSYYDRFTYIMLAVIISYILNRGSLKYEKTT